jgi:HK97 family phage major capsid protein
MPAETTEIKTLVEEIKQSTAGIQERYSTLEERGQKTEEKLEEAKEQFGIMSEKLQEIVLKAEAEEKAREELELAIARIPEKSADAETVGDENYRKSWADYARKGEIPAKEILEAEGEIFSKINGESQEAKALVVGSNPDGGYLVPIDAARLIVTRVFETSPMRSVSNVITTSREAVEIILDDQEADSGWVAELDERTETGTPKIGVKEIPTHEQYAEPKITTKMLDDASINIESWLSMKISDKFGRVENTSFVAGDGIKKPTGFTTYPAWADSEIYERNALAHIETATASTIAADDLIALQTALLEPYQPGAVFMMNRKTWGNSILTLKDAVDGNYLINPQLIFSGATFQLLGRPVRLASDMADVADAAEPVAYGNFREGYLIVDRIGIRVLRDPYTDKRYVKYYTTKRVGGDVVNFQAIKLLTIQSA